MATWRPEQSVGGRSPTELSPLERVPAEQNARARALRLLHSVKVPFLVGGAYAYAHHTGIHRETKDLDLFLRQADADRALAVLEQAGFRVEWGVHGWLHKAFWGEHLIDLIYSAGNGVTEVDEGWFQHAESTRVLGQPSRVVAVEEMIWSKAFVLERGRFDGPEINHLLLRAGPRLDWERLLWRFSRHWELLLAHLMFFRFAYPSDRQAIPDAVMAELMARTLSTLREGNLAGRLCRGQLTSQVNYRVDLEQWGYRAGDPDGGGGG